MEEETETSTKYNEITIENKGDWNINNDLVQPEVILTIPGKNKQTEIMLIA